MRVLSYEGDGRDDIGPGGPTPAGPRRRGREVGAGFRPSFCFFLFCYFLFSENLKGREENEGK